MRTPLLCVLVASSAFAHIKLDAPPAWQVTDALGNPQKVGPCGEAGTASNAVTTVMAGSMLTVQWHETIYHPGHFRLSIAQNRSSLITPTANVVNNNCVSAPIETSPALPTIADGLFPTHTGAMTTHSQTIRVPMMSCENCTLQLLQFMSSHSPPCFYFQCATLRIVMPDAGVDAGLPDAGAPDAGLPDAGADAGLPDAGDPDAGQADAGMTDAGSDAGGMLADGGMEPTMPGGCGCASGVDGLALAAGLMLLVRRRGR